MTAAANTYVIRTGTITKIVEYNPRRRALFVSANNGITVWFDETEALAGGGFTVSTTDWLQWSYLEQGPIVFGPLFYNTAGDVFVAEWISDEGDISLASRVAAQRIIDTALNCGFSGPKQSE